MTLPTLIHCHQNVVAEHAIATAPGQRIESPAHVRERWERSVPTVVPPPKGWHITFTEAVEARPLAVYAEVAS